MIINIVTVFTLKEYYNLSFLPVMSTYTKVLYHESLTILHNTPGLDVPHVENVQNFSGFELGTISNLLLNNTPIVEKTEILRTARSYK